MSLGTHLPYFPLWLRGQGFSCRADRHHPGGADVPARGDDAAAHRAGRPGEGPGQCLYRAGRRHHWCFPPAISCTPTYAMVLAVSLALTVVWTPHSPIADSLALSGVRRFGSNYTAMRIWGSISYLCANVAGGFILAWTSAAGRAGDHLRVACRRARRRPAGAAARPAAQGLAAFGDRDPAFGAEPAQSAISSISPSASASSPPAMPFSTASYRSTGSRSASATRSSACCGPGAWSPKSACSWFSTAFSAPSRSSR